MTNRGKQDDQKVYDDIVFQDGRVLAGPDGMGFLELSTINLTFAIIHQRKQC